MGQGEVGAEPLGPRGATAHVRHWTPPCGSDRNARAQGGRETGRLPKYIIILYLKRARESDHRAIICKKDRGRKLTVGCPVVVASYPASGTCLYRRRQAAKGFFRR